MTTEMEMAIRDTEKTWKPISDLLINAPDITPMPVSDLATILHKYIKDNQIHIGGNHHAKITKDIT